MASYNTYDFMPFILYRIVEYLAYHNEKIWKILKYNDFDCLSHANLTFEEKMELIWNGDESQKEYSIFFTKLVEDAIPESKTILKIYQSNIIPKNTIKGIGVYEFDILYGGKIALMDYEGVPCNRGDVLESEILKTLNGVDVGGVGLLQFNTQLSPFVKSIFHLGNSKTYTGVSLLMGLDLSDIGEQQCL